MPQEQKGQRERPRFFVYVIESPSSLVLYSRKWEGVILTKALSSAGIPSCYRIAIDLKTFKLSLTDGLQECLIQVDHLAPILHISSQGSSQGIQFTNEEVLEWNELRDLIMPINKACKGNLVLCISSCEGFSACKMALEESDIPFLAVVGHSGKPTLSDTAIAFATFYHLIAKGYTLIDAEKAMKIASGDDGFGEILGVGAKQIYIEEIRKLRIQSLVEALNRVRPKNP